MRGAAHGLGAYVLTQGCDIGRTHSILLDGGATEAQCVTHFHPFPRSSFTLFPTFCGLQLRLHPGEMVVGYRGLPARQVGGRRYIPSGGVRVAG